MHVSGSKFRFCKKETFANNLAEKMAEKISDCDLKNSNYCTVFQGYHKFICQEVVRVANNM
jgi:hypothetical protein